MSSNIINIGNFFQKQNSICMCERGTDANRIECLVKEYQKLMQSRHKPLTRQHYDQLINSRRLIDIKLATIETASLPEALAESQILYTFYQNYTKTHPQLLRDGPEIGDIKLKTHFFTST